MLKVIKNIHGSYLIVYNNYIYRIVKRNENSINWRCIKPVCSSTAISNIFINYQTINFSIKRPHSHEANILEAKKHEILDKTRELIMSGISSTREIVKLITRGGNAILVQSIGNFENFFRLIRDYKLKVLNPKPYLFRTLKLNAKLTQTFTNEVFFKFGPDNFLSFEPFEDFILFFSDSSLSALNQNLVWAVDGTFGIVAKPYVQLFTLSYIKNHHVFPVIYGVLKNKKLNTYNKLYTILKQFGISNNPISIKTDFEIASVSALKIHFPNSKISGCLFHFGQALYRKIQSLGLSSLYKMDGNVNRFAKCLNGLPYAKKEMVLETFNQLKRHQDFPICLKEFYDYFFRTYLNGGNSSVFDLELWHYGEILNDDIPRTNNAIEGWHSAFKQSFSSCRYSLILLIQKMREEEDLMRIKRLQMDLGEVLIRKKKYLRLENDLKRFLNENRDNNSGVEFVFMLNDFLSYD